MDWLKSNWKFVALILTVVASAFGVKLTTTTSPNVSGPEVHIILPEAGGELNVMQGPGDRVRDFRPVLKVRCAIVLAKEKNIPLREAITKVFKSVKDEHIVAGFESEGFQAAKAIVDGTFLKNLIDWLSDPANQEKIMAVIKFILMLAALVHNDVPPDLNWPASLVSWYC